MPLLKKLTINDSSTTTAEVEGKIIAAHWDNGYWHVLVEPNPPRCTCCDADD